MAAIDLALVVISTLPPHAATEGRVADLQQWDSDPKWQRLALLILEKQLLPQQMLMTSPAIVGAMIADALGNQKK